MHTFRKESQTFAPEGGGGGGAGGVKELFNMRDGM